MSHQALNEEQFGPYFHGTSAELRAGDVLNPPGQEGPRSFKVPHPLYSPEHVYFTTSRSQAESYAQSRATKHGGSPRVYEVEPHGETEKDPETAGVKGWDVSYRSPAARIRREIEYRQ
jgi:hypothetical protein